MAKTKEPKEYPYGPDSVWEPIIPPKAFSILKLMIVDGPNAQAMEHSHYAPSMDEMLARAPVFTLLLPIQLKERSRPWPSRESFGPCHHLDVAIEIGRSHRCNDTVFNVQGHVVVTTGGTAAVLSEIRLLKYSTQERRAQVRMPREDYNALLRYWRAGRL